MSELQNWLYAPLMFLEMLAASYMVGHRFSRKMCFGLRLAGGAVVGVVTALWTELIFAAATGNFFIYDRSTDLLNIGFKIGYYLEIFLMTIGCIAFSCKIPFITVLVCCSMGYAIQHIAANCSVLATACLRYFWGGPFHVAQFVIYVLSRGIIYWLFYKAMFRGDAYNLEYLGNNYKKATLSVAVVVVCIGLSRLINEGFVEESLVTMLAYATYSSLCCLLIVAFQFDLFENDVMHDQVKLMAELLHQEKEYYKMSKENIDIINIKYHDLKKMVTSLKENYSAQSLAEIENAVAFYDAAIKTGNKVLDVVLTQKELQCRAKQIQLICMAKGELLDFMDEMDIHSLFGNALSNAIESVEQEKDPQHRHISLKVSNQMNLCSIHIENYFSGQLKLQDGLPQTQKDPNYHGFGMQSMRRIVDKYNGVLTVSQTENKFNLDVLLPLS